MVQHVARVIGVGTARAQIGCVVGERHRPSDWARTVAGSARQLLGALAGLPEVEDVLVVGVFVIVGGADVAQPVAALAVCTTDNPDTSASPVPAVGDREAGCDGGEVVGFGPGLQLQAVAPGLDA